MSVGTRAFVDFASRWSGADDARAHVAGTLIATKHRPPPLRPGEVARQSLESRIAAGVVSGARLTLVSAPAGYGKTSLARGWLARDGGRAAWVALDEADNDPATFVAYLRAAMHEAEPAVLANIPDPLPVGPPTRSLAQALNVLGSSGGRVAVVLDDYQVIRSPVVHTITAFLLTHLPPTTHALVVTREDPPLPLARLRARGQMTEIRAADLRFSVEEACRFLRGTIGVDLSDEAVARLVDKAEGWPAGLQLAGLSLARCADADAFIQGFGATDRHVVDYLGEEVLRGLRPSVRAFLHRTSVLDRLCAGVCDELSGRRDSAVLLERLDRQNMFLAALDEHREWYRYHQLFADFLQSWLEPEERRALHHLAAGWFMDHGHWTEAIRHALASGDAETAADWMEAAADAAIGRGEFATVRSWAAALPGETLSRHASLRVHAGWAQFFAGDIAAAAETAAGVAASPLGERAIGRLLGLRSWLANRQDGPDAAALASEGIARIPASDAVYRGMVLCARGETLVGRHACDAQHAFAEARELARAAGATFLEIGATYQWAMAGLLAGRRQDAVDACLESISQLRASMPRAPVEGLLHLPLGIASYEADDLDAARQHLALGRELTSRAGLETTMLGPADWVEIRLLHLLGEESRAWELLESVRRRSERHRVPRIAAAMQALSAELHLLEGEPALAARALEAVPDWFPASLGQLPIRACHTRARVLLVLRRPRDALRLLAPVAANQRSNGQLGQLITTLVVLAEAHLGAGDPDSARQLLREAIGHAAPEEYRRAFLDQGAGLLPLLRSVSDAAPPFVTGLLPGPPDGDSGAAAPGRSGLAEPLTARECDVLRLAAAGLSNREIARELYLTPGTAKWHVHNVLAKLAVRGRRELRPRAHALGLL